MQRRKPFLIMAAPVEQIANHQDLLIEILIRLPVKPLLKFKRVSKQWRSIISDPQFALSQTRHHQKKGTFTPSALLLEKDYNPYSQFQSVPLKNLTPKLPCLDYLDARYDEIIQSCNGLLLCISNSLMIPRGLELEECTSYSVTEYDGVTEDDGVTDDDGVTEVDGVTVDDIGFWYFICNLTTKQFKRISFPSRVFMASVVALSLAFDPLKSPYYNVIFIRVVDEKDDRYRIDIYSSKTDSWSILGISFTRPKRMAIHAPIYCNGAVHWFSDLEISLYFDVEKECLKTMSMPQLSEYWHKVYNWYFGEYRGHLYIVITTIPSVLDFNVFEMAKDYSGWFVKYHVNLDAVRIVFPWLIRHPEHSFIDVLSILCVIRAEKEEESRVVVFVAGKVISYNVSDGTLKELCEFEPRCLVGLPLIEDGGHDTFQHFETLYCV